MSMPITRLIRSPPCLGQGSGGPHDNYGSALAAQPGGSQGRPATNASSQLIERIGLPTLHAPSAPQPGRSHHTRRSPDPRRAWGTTGIMPVTNPVESTFATVRLRTDKTKGCLSRKTALALVFKLARSAERHWRRLNGSDRLAAIVRGVCFRDGEAVTAAEDQAAA